MNTVNVGNQVDDIDLDAELEAMQQEQLDEQMLNTGTVPVSDQIQRLPAAGDGPSKPNSTRDLETWRFSFFLSGLLTGAAIVKTGKTPAAVEDDEEAELQKLQAEMAMS